MALGALIRGGFLGEEDRKGLIALARDGSVVCRVTRRANALVLLDAGKSCQEVAEVLLFDDDTIRGWYDRPVRTGRRRRPDQFRHGRQCEQDERRASGGLEGVGDGEPATLDAISAPGSPRNSALFTRAARG